MEQDQQTRWRPTRRQVLWIVGVVVALVVAIIVLGYVREWEWTGLVKDKSYTKRTLWDWLQLLIIPAVLAGVGLWFNRQQREQELQTADRCAQDEALQAYLDQMSAMLIPNKDQPSLYKAGPGDSLSSVARARTLTVLPRLDGDRKARVVQFLYEAGLIAKGAPVIDLGGADLSFAELSGTKLSLGDRVYARLSNADLSYANLSHADLSSVSLSGTKLSRTNLSHTNLVVARLSHANLSHANLSHANLSGAILSHADLSHADLSNADLSNANLIMANLSDANLSDANLYLVDLTNADLSEADLSNAYLAGAKLHEADPDHLSFLNKHLERHAKFLAGATMPTGQKYEDWLKDREKRQQDERNE